MAKKKQIFFDPKVFLSHVGGGRTHVKYDASTAIFTQGDMADAVFYLQKGKAKVAVLSKNGREAVLALIGPGDFFGEGCLNGQLRRLATVTALTDCAVMRLDKLAMVRVLHDEPKFADLFINYLLHRNSRVEEV